jgi:hypothetical protein
MNELDAYTRDYRVAFLGYLPRRGEAGLHRGYELGRAAVTCGMSLLDLARVHHDVLLEVLRETPPAELSEVTTAASELFLEVLATFDMTQRAFRATNGPPPDVPDPRPGSGVRALRPGAR